MSAPAVIDLRSDTVTRPTPAMREAMATAEVGDDVFGDDPTVHRLQARVAELLGTEAALFTPSGTMANQIALRAHTQPGDEVIIGWGAHCWRHESGALGALAGLQTQVAGTTGTYTAADVRACWRPADPYSATTRVVAVENTHNMAGGIVWDRAELRGVTDAAHELGMATHLDGARLWNAAIASGCSEKELATGFDSISVCLSKGLGAPIGSVVAGSRAFIAKCHRFRKMYGGGMRQAGILAAAALYALDHNRARLADDHANAKALAEALASAPNLRVDLARVQTNILMIDVIAGTAGAVVAGAKARGVLVGASGAEGGQRIRAVTHLDVTRAQIATAAQVLADVARDVAA